MRVTTSKVDLGLKQVGHHWPKPTPFMTSLTKKLKPKT